MRYALHANNKGTPFSAYPCCACAVLMTTLLLQLLHQLRILDDYLKFSLGDVFRENIATIS